MSLSLPLSLPLSLGVSLEAGSEAICAVSFTQRSSFAWISMTRPSAALSCFFLSTLTSRKSRIKASSARSSHIISVLRSL